MGQFSAGPVNKAVLSFKNSSTEYMKADRRRCEHFSLIKDSHFQCLCYLVELGQLLLSHNCQVDITKSKSNFVNSVDNVTKIYTFATE